jgi:hypothetical protein
MISDTRRRSIIKIQERMCPRLHCADCAIRNGDIIDTGDKWGGRQTRCSFYDQYPDGYAGGYVLQDGEYVRKMNMDCPREQVWCCDCPKGTKDKPCAEMKAALRQRYKQTVANKR